MSSVTVAGNPVSIRSGSLQIENALEARSTCTFMIKDTTGASYVRGQSVTVLNDDNGKEFSGVIWEAEAFKIPPINGSNTTIWWDVQCVDWHYLADKRVVAETYTNQTAGYIVNDLITKYLAAEGVTVGTIEAGPTITKTLFNYVPPSEAIAKLAEEVDFWWVIDSEKALHFRKRDVSPAAPWVVTYSDVVAGSVKSSMPKYRNRQFIRGGKDLTSLQIEEFLGDGKQQTFTVAYPIGVTPVVKVNGVAQTVGIRGIEEGKQWYWNKDDHTITQDSSGTKLTSAQTLRVEYQGMFALIAMSSDQANIIERQSIEGGTGYVDDVVDDPKVDTRERAFTLAASLLQKYSKLGKQISFKTARRGLVVGQLATIQFPSHNAANEQALIAEVSISDEVNRFVYDVKAVTGPYEGAWQRMFLNLQAQAADLLELVATDTAEHITIFVGPYNESVALTESGLNQLVFACSVPSSTLFPSSTLYPC